jgi:F0F1-type ATP synthase membrane subunit b/b'
MEESAQSEAGKIAQAAEQEIATAAKAARRELQRYSAELAVGLAEKRIRESISPDAEQRMLRSFVNDLTDHDGSPSGREPS